MHRPRHGGHQYFGSGEEGAGEEDMGGADKAADSEESEQA